MKYVSEAKYTIRKTLGQYEHEELSLTITQDNENPVTGEELLAEARRACVSQTTEAKRRAKSNPPASTPKAS